jgi:hypothetical protein
MICTSIYLEKHPISNKTLVQRVLKREIPGRIVYAPNYWQWFAHNCNHNTLPEEIKDCKSQLDLINYLGLSVFSRNIYCDQRKSWFGGLAEPMYDNVEVEINEYNDKKDTVIEKTYRCPSGDLKERLRYVFQGSTLVQEKFLLDDYENQLKLLEELISSQDWRFFPERYEKVSAQAGESGVIIAGEVFSPLKMLHFFVGSVQTTYLLADHPERVKKILDIHEQAQLELVEQYGFLGGIATVVPVNWFGEYKPEVHGGFTEEIVERLRLKGLL